MKHAGVLALLLLAAALAGCDRDAHRNETTVLGGYGQGGSAATMPTDAQGRTIPAPPAPGGTRVAVVRSADEQALAAWIADKRVLAATWTPASGWSAPQPLEEIYGETSDVQLASNGRGRAMAMWHQRVGNIHSLRFSRFDAKTGWSTPDVVPGALPRPDVAGVAPDDAPHLQMDAQGNVVAQWPSGFQPNEMQQARYVAGQGWTAPVSERLASGPTASPGSPAPASAR